jgi:hypothetical protein
VYISYAWTSSMFAIGPIPSLFTQTTCAITRPCLYIRFTLLHTDQRYSSFVQALLCCTVPSFEPSRQLFPNINPQHHLSRDDTTSHHIDIYNTPCAPPPCSSPCRRSPSRSRFPCLTMSSARSRAGSHRLPRLPLLPSPPRLRRYRYSGTCPDSCQLQGAHQAWCRISQHRHRGVDGLRYWRQRNMLWLVQTF